MKDRLKEERIGKRDRKEDKGETERRGLEKIGVGGKKETYTEPRTV